MPATILSLLTSSGNISIIDERKKNPIMESLKIKSVSIDNYSDVSDFPLADTQLTSTVIYKNTQRSDLGSGKVILPTKVLIVAFSSDVSVTSSIFSTWEDLESSVQIITRSVIIPYLVISEIVVTQSPDMLNAVQINITFQQTSTPTQAGYTPQQSGDSSSVGISFQSTVSITDTVTEFINQISSTLGF